MMTSIRHFLASRETWWLKPSGSAFEVESDIITLPGTSFRVIYSKPKKSVAFGVHGDKDAGLSQVDFLSRAWRVANDKARELRVDRKRSSVSAGEEARS